MPDKYVRSPIRYPGGKSRAVKEILKRFPEDCGTYIEPFVGGGSVLLAAIQSGIQFNGYFAFDAYAPLISFWNAVQFDRLELYEAVLGIFRSTEPRRELYDRILRDDINLLNAGFNAHSRRFHEAVKFFVLNRITFSGTTESGGFSQKAADGRFTLSSIERMWDVGDVLNLNPVLTPVRFLCNRFQYPLNCTVYDDCFAFLDPPYYTASRLYGKKGALHDEFDHKLLAEILKEQHTYIKSRGRKFKFLMTYDDCPEVRELYSWCKIETWNLQYSMDNVSAKPKKGAELFISNY